jgi:hypothetical protein
MVDVKIKVAISTGDPLPDDTRIEVSAQEQACGQLNDPRKPLDSNGEATFAKMPVCVISVKALLKGYIQVRIEMNGRKLTSRAVDLREYANTLSIVMEKEQ